MIDRSDSLWVVGSHGLKRKNAKPNRDHADNAKCLAKVALDGNRRPLRFETALTESVAQPPRAWHQPRRGEL